MDIRANALRVQPIYHFDLIHLSLHRGKHKRQQQESHWRQQRTSFQAHELWIQNLITLYVLFITCINIHTKERWSIPHARLNKWQLGHVFVEDARLERKKEDADYNHNRELSPFIYSYGWRYQKAIIWQMPSFPLLTDQMQWEICIIKAIDLVNIKPHHGWWTSVKPPWGPPQGKGAKIEP